MLAQHSKISKGIVGWSAESFSSMQSVTACTLSQRPFCQGELAAVVQISTFRVEQTALISSLENSPPLSCKMVPMRPKCPTQCFMILSITIEGFLRSMMIDNVRRDHISIKWRIHLLFHFLRSIATFSLNLLANGKHTDGLAGVDANLLHTSQRLRISSNMTWASANSSRPASFKRDNNFAVGGWANCRCNLRSEAFFSESFAPRSRANTSKSISRRGRE